MYLRKGAIVLANTKLYSKQNHCSKLPRPIDISIFAENHNLHVPIYFGSEGASMFAGNDFFQRIFPPSFPWQTTVVKVLLATTMNSSCPSLLMSAVIGSIVPPTPGNVHSIVPMVALTSRIPAPSGINSRTPLPPMSPTSSTGTTFFHIARYGKQFRRYRYS